MHNEVILLVVQNLNPMHLIHLQRALHYLVQCTTFSITLHFWKTIIIKAFNLVHLLLLLNAVTDLKLCILLVLIDVDSRVFVFFDDTTLKTELTKNIIEINTIALII
jgi:hypothetical protein